jgi:integrase/recombinase XerD
VSAPIVSVLGYLVDRNYSCSTVWTYGFDLLAFCRRLMEQDIELPVVHTGELLKYLSSTCSRT